MAKTKKDTKEEKQDLTQIKQELEEYIDSKIKTSFNEEVDKANKKLIREKNKKIIFRNIIIVLLLVIMGFLTYLLYKDHYFDKFFNHNEKTINEITNDNEPIPEKEPKITLQELINKYEKLFDSYFITSKCQYKSDLYTGNLSSELKKYMTLNVIDFKSIESDNYNIISEKTFKQVFDTLFNDGYVSGNFDYNDNEMRYLKDFESYVSSEILTKKDFDIVREILDIKEEDTKVIITTIEGVLNNNHLYNVLTNEEVIDFNGNSILNYQDKLNKITYIFENNKLISLMK